MSAKKSTQVLIGGKIYTLSGYEEEDYLQKIATYINGKLSEFEELESIHNFTVDMKNTLLDINIADDYFKAKDLCEKYEGDLENKDKEIYDLKHDLISNQVRIETLEEQIGTLEAEKKELLALKARLEASLEDALLGPGSED
jgi:cell division protein ZapA